MLNNKVDFSFTSYSIINKKNKILKTIKAKKIITYNDLIKSCDIGLSTVMIKKNLLLKNRFTKIKTKEDYVLWLRLSKRNIKMLGINEILASWRQTNNSLSSSIPQKLKDAFFIYNHHLKFNFLKSICCIFLMSLNFFRKRYL